MHSDEDFYNYEDMDGSAEDSISSQAQRAGEIDITLDMELPNDSGDELPQGNGNNNNSEDDDWIFEEGLSTEELDTEWDNKREADTTVGLDTIIDNVDRSLDKDKLLTMSQRYTNPTIVAMFLLYTKHLLSVDAYSDLINIVQQT
jgi:hypothetical protein